LIRSSSGLTGKERKITKKSSKGDLGGGKKIGYGHFWYSKKKART